MRRKKSARKPSTAKREQVAELDRVARVARERVVLDAAARLLVRSGPDGFNVRALAQAVGASTTVVYTLFGGRDGVLAALHRDCLERLADELARVEAGDPRSTLGALALAYRRFALANPHYYHAASAASASAEVARTVRGSRAYGLLLATVRECIASQLLASHEPETITDSLWGLVHGMVLLELGGHFESALVARARFVAAGIAMLDGFRPRK